MKYTIVQDSRKMELLKQNIPAGTGPGAKFGDSSEFIVLSPPIWHLFDPSQPFTLTWSAGDMSSTFPACDTWSGTLNVSSCADPKIVPSVSPSGSAAAVPTLGEVGLLLSGIALAGAAAPALRRRSEKQGKRADTHK